MPDNFGFISSPGEKHHVEANTYAALKELNAINEHIFNNGPAVDLKYSFDDSQKTADCLPYDYCFLYDFDNRDYTFDFSYIVDAIWARLFGESSDCLNDVFVSKMRKELRKSARNLYGMVLESKIHLSENEFEDINYIKDSCHELVRSTMNQLKINDDGRHIICAWIVPKGVEFEVEEFSYESRVVFEPGVDCITLTVFSFGLEISSHEKLKHDSGKYYKSYKEMVKCLPKVMTVHLDKNWHETLPDIGCDSYDMSYISIHNKQVIPKESFVFISYSSRETYVAEQTKRILENNGILCWMAPQSIPAGSDYGSEIPKAINECKVFVLLLSKASQESNWVPKEVGRAIGQGKIVIPFQIDDETIRETFDFMLTNNQRINAYNRMSDAYQELVNRLLDIL